MTTSIHRQADQPRRRARQGDRRRRSTPPSTTSRISPTASSSPAPSPRDEITRIDASEALGSRGVLQVFTHENAPRLARSDRSYQRRGRAARLAVPPAPRRRDQVQRPARRAGRRRRRSSWRDTRRRSVRVEYEREPHATDLRATARAGLRAAGRHETAWVRRTNRAATPKRPSPTPPSGIEAEYALPVEHHNPMELFATTVVWDDDGKLTVYDKTQGVQNFRTTSASVFGFSKDEVRVLSPFVGGAFGSGLRPQYQVFLAVLAARELKRSVRVALTRQQMFTFGHRPATLQRVALGANADGTLEAVIHEARRRDLAVRGLQRERRQLVGPALPVRQRRSSTTRSRSSTCTRRSTCARRGRAGACTRSNRAMDELAVKLGIDPVELRLKNYAETRSERRQAVLEQGTARMLPAGRRAVRLGAAQPAAAVDARGRSADRLGHGDRRLGGHAARGQRQGRADRDGKLTVSSATADIGTGTYTIMTQIAAETLGCRSRT